MIDGIVQYAYMNSIYFSIEKAAGPKSSAVAPCEVVEPVTLVRLRSKMLSLSVIETEYSVTLAICLTH